MEALFALTTAGILTVTLGACALTGASEPVAGVSPQDQGASEQLSQTTFTVGDGSAIRLAGSATIGSWDCTAYEARGALIPGATISEIHRVIDHIDARLNNGEKIEADDVELPLDRPPLALLQVRVEALSCGNAGMEKDMRKALKASDHPHIQYELERVVDVRWELSQETARPVFHLTTRGQLTLAGEKRTVPMDVRVERLDEGRFAVVGAKTLDMADFNIEPPSAFFGLIRADSAVTVVFDLVVEPKVETQETDEPATP